MTKKTEIITLEKLNAGSLMAVSEWTLKLNKLVEDHPFVEITDSATYEQAKKSRTALKSGRTELEAQDKTLASQFAKIRKEAGLKKDELILIVKPGEDKQQEEINRHEKEIEDRKLEKQRIEDARIESIKNKIDEIETEGYRLIGGMTFLTYPTFKDAINAIFETDFDFEEYDILLTHAKKRVNDSYELKSKTLIEKEEQRLETERLQRENALAKKREELQSKRLELLYPVMAFTKYIKLMDLHLMEEEAFTAVLNDAKLLKEESDRKALEDENEATRLREEREQKDREEKEKVFEIRKQRLLEYGFECIKGDYVKEGYCIIVNDVLNSNAIDFEAMFNDAKKSIEEKNLQDRYNNRVRRMLSIGMHKGSDDEYVTPMTKNNLCWAITKNQLLKDNDDIFNENIKDCKNHIDLISEEKKQSEKENIVRQKALKKDKELLVEYVEGLAFRLDVPNFKNDESEKMLNHVDEKLSEFKKSIVEYINNY